MLCIAQKLRRLEKRFKTFQNRDYEKAVILYLAIQSFSAVSCVIDLIENGKDGYTATIVDSNGKKYVTAVSINNLGNSGKNYKQYKIGDTISVTGVSWTDHEGNTDLPAEKITLIQ
jgi:hypothetical protein